MNDDLDRSFVGKFCAAYRGVILVVHFVAVLFFPSEQRERRVDLLWRDGQSIQIIECSFILEAAQISIADHLFISVKGDSEKTKSG